MNNLRTRMGEIYPRTVRRYSIKSGYKNPNPTNHNNIQQRKNRKL